MLFLVYQSSVSRRESWFLYWAVAGFAMRLFLTVPLGVLQSVIVELPGQVSPFSYSSIKYHAREPLYSNSAVIAW